MTQSYFCQFVYTVFDEQLIEIIADRKTSLIVRITDQEAMLYQCLIDNIEDLETILY